MHIFFFNIYSCQKKYFSIVYYVSYLMKESLSILIKETWRDTLLHSRVFPLHVYYLC